MRYIDRIGLKQRIHWRHFQIDSYATRKKMFLNVPKIVTISCPTLPRCFPTICNDETRLNFSQISRANFGVFEWEREITSTSDKISVSTQAGMANQANFPPYISRLPWRGFSHLCSALETVTCFWTLEPSRGFRARDPVVNPVVPRYQNPQGRTATYIHPELALLRVPRPNSFHST